MFNFFKPSPKKYVEKTIKKHFSSSAEMFLKMNNIKLGESNFISNHRFYIHLLDLKKYFLANTAYNLYQNVLVKYNLSSLDSNDKFNFDEYMIIVRNTINNYISIYFESNDPDNDND
jgi:hypothetical protein